MGNSHKHKDELIIYGEIINFPHSCFLPNFLPKKSLLPESQYLSSLHRLQVIFAENK
ncbi:hypothetical protein [Cyanobacterium aponinum]|uniref:Uncharacterized protein n=1 Tax=Cyanobacterium aponinum 0216 TaxID=2676140 RepID=A0A844GW74_9CHRO|nr:hypothetical protein [Cyanobacterium aponinum]MTF39302.1 hypothetical protein [Cyanobacterium aponinum 0216]